MAGEALRKVFAEFGIKWKTDELERGEKKVEGATKSVRGFVQSGVTDALKAKLNGISPVLGKLFENFDKLDAKTLKAAKSVLAAGVTLAAAGLLLKKAFDFADSFSAVGEELRDTGRDLRMTTTDLQGMRFAAAQSGVGVDRMASAMRKFRTDLNSAERWGNSTTWMLRRLGVQARDGTGRIRPMADLMGDLAVAFDRVPNPLRRTRIAVRLFGEDGRRMLDVMHGGAGGLAALRDEFETLGGVSEEAVAASREYTMATTRLSVAQDALRSNLATSIMPLLAQLLGGITKLVVVFVKFTRGTRLVEVALGALAIAGTAAAITMIAAWLPVVLPFVLAGIAIAAVILKVEDIIGLFNGADSSLGRFIDRLFGVGAAATGVRYLKESFEDLIEVISDNLWILGPIAQLSALATADKPAEGRLRNQLRLREGSQAPLPVASSVADVSVPNRRQVDAVVSRVAPVRNTTIQRAGDTNTFHIVNPSPTAVAREVERRMEERAARERDAAHPVDALE